MWTEYIDPALVIIDPDVKDKKDLFKRMVNLAYNLDLVVDKKACLKALLKRESAGSTELMPGVALPHVRSESCDRLFLCIILIREGLDYENDEMGPARIVFFFGTPERDNRQYLQLLARASRLLRTEEFQKQLLAAKSREDILDLLKLHDNTPEDGRETATYNMTVTLHDRKRLDTLLEALVELGVTSAAVVETQSMARKLAYEMPVFAGPSYMSSGKTPDSTMVQCVIRDRTIPQRLYGLLRQNGIDFSRPDEGFIQLTRIDDLIGSPEETIEL